LQISSQLLESSPATRHEHEIGAVVRECLSERFSDPRRRAGDQRSLPLRRPAAPSP
jgi:hypothetical protein